ncbi:hypothetical protein [Piscinibacter sp.]|uniref:hypothetical protein n=1 Tax=Piscinibacter sp. TaxID=1903157 RepID=UPI002B601153|nr:hypothetical protein [Albitalea sp.]HUG25078.1 hypothetical protein [Albitalea sp.]
MKNPVRAGLASLVALFCGCAQINWERAGYEDMRRRAKEQARQHGAAAVPDPNLPTYERYEEERERLRRSE